jgi:hypothetical protein
LREKKLKPSLIISTIYPNEPYKNEHKEGKFISDYQIGDSKYKDLGGFIGLFKYKNNEIPVIRARGRSRGQAEEICIFDLDKYANFIQYPPYSQTSEKSFRKDIFIFRIIDLNKDNDLRQKILVKKPEWLQKYENADRLLKQKVVTNILERFELRIINRSAGIKFILPEDSS